MDHSGASHENLSVQKQQIKFKNSILTFSVTFSSCYICCLTWPPLEKGPVGLIRELRSSVSYFSCVMNGKLVLTFLSLAIGEGNDNPLQYSCLENPRDGGAWWAAVYGVSQSWTRLKRLSSSSSKLSYTLGNIHGNSTVALQTECWLKRKWSSLNWTFK